MEQEIFLIQNQLNEVNAHLKVIRRWVTIAGWIFIIIPITAIILLWGTLTALFLGS
jgi:hypothetical protein